jgi:hypothetical protein
MYSVLTHIVCEYPCILPFHESLQSRLSTYGFLRTLWFLFLFNHVYPANVPKCAIAIKNCSILPAPLVNTAWCVLRLKTEWAGSSYGGQLQICWIDSYGMVLQVGTLAWTNNFTPWKTSSLGNVTKGLWRKQFFIMTIGAWILKLKWREGVRYIRWLGIRDSMNTVINFRVL